MAQGKSPPELVPVIKIEPVGHFIFPGREIAMEYTGEERRKEYYRQIRLCDHAIFAPQFNDAQGKPPKAFPLGTLAKMVAKKPTPDLIIEFEGLMRVRYELAGGKIEHGVAMGRWTQIVDKPVAPEVFLLPELHSALEHLKQVFNDLMAEATNAEIFKQKFVRETVTAVEDLDKNINQDTLTSLLDDIMNMMPYINFEEEKPIDLLRPFLVIFQQTDLLERLASITMLLDILAHPPPMVGMSETDPAPHMDDALIQNLLSAPRELPSTAPPVAKEVSRNDWVRLDPTLRSENFQKGMQFFGQRMVNQVRPIEQLLLAVTSIRIGMKDLNRPEVAGIFSGPTGVGKTESVKILAEFLFGDPAGYIHIEGNTLILPHSVARLTGAEPGYIGYDEEPRITQWKLDKAHVMWMVRNAYKGRGDELRKVVAEIAELEGQLSMARQGAVRTDRKPLRRRLMKLTGWKPGAHLGLILIDEIEKAHENVQRALIRVLDDGLLQLANGETVNCTNTIFILTSNIYGREIAARISGKYIFGIRPAFKDSSGEHEKLSDIIYRETVNALEKFLLPEFLGRIGKENVRVFHPFSPEDISAIIEKIELPAFAKRLRGRGIEPFITIEALLFIKKEVMDPTNRSLGARAIKSVIQRRLREAISALIDVGEHGGIVSGDHVLIDVENKDDGDGKRIVIKKLVRSS